MTVCKLGGGFVLASVLALGGACDGGGGDETGADGTGSETSPPIYSHAADIQPLWDIYCVETCHDPEGLTPGTGTVGLWGVTLNMTTSEMSYAGMVDMQSELYPTIIVTPGSPDDSYLVGKLLMMPSEYGGGGLSMPQPREGLPSEMTDDEIQMVIDWIAGGAMP